MIRHARIHFEFGWPPQRNDQGSFEQLDRPNGRDDARPFLSATLSKDRPVLREAGAEGNIRCLNAHLVGEASDSSRQDVLERDGASKRSGGEGRFLVGEIVAEGDKVRS